MKCPQCASVNYEKKGNLQKADHFIVHKYKCLKCFNNFHTIEFVARSVHIGKFWSSPLKSIMQMLTNNWKDERNESANWPVYKFDPNKRYNEQKKRPFVMKDRLAKSNSDKSNKLLDSSKPKNN